jgi:glycosyltransferase involved in cell wall biosynthesis
MPIDAQRLTLFNGLSIIIPVYNAQDTLKELAARLVKVLEQITNSFEILLINDGSRDNSWQIIQELAGQDKRFHGTDLIRNYGQINALMCGLKQARFDLALTMDDDLQHPPEEIPLLLSLMETGQYDVVYGVYDQKKDSWLRMLGSEFIDFLYNRIFHKPSQLKLSSFRLIGPECLLAIKNYPPPYLQLHPIILNKTRKIGNVTVHHEPRKSGASGYSVNKLFGITMGLVFGQVLSRDRKR